MPEPIAITHPRSAAAEAYRSLRANLAFVRPGEVARSLLVCSPAPDADASEVAANLAVVCAQADQSVILVDADLRRPAQHGHFGLPNGPGLAGALQDGEDGEPPLQASGVAGLSVLTGGPPPPNPGGLLASRRMQALLADLGRRADLVIVGAPPLMAASDGAALAPRLDGVLLVLRAGRSRRDHARRARALLDTIGATLLGAVLTGLAPDHPAYGDDR